MSAHTQGPWFDDGYRIYAPTTDADKRNGRVIVEYKHVDDFNRADAPLIAAAPELLAALQSVKGACFTITPVRGESCCRFCGAFEGSHHDFDCTMRSVEAAIQKAEGADAR